MGQPGPQRPKMAEALGAQLHQVPVPLVVIAPSDLFTPGEAERVAQTHAQQGPAEGSGVRDRHRMAHGTGGLATEDSQALHQTF